MRKLLGLILLSGFLVGTVIVPIQSQQPPTQQSKNDEPKADPPKRKLGIPPKPKPPVKSFGSGEPKLHEDPKPPVKSFGSGSNPKPSDRPNPPVKSFGSGNKTPPADVGSKPKGNFDNKAAIDQRKVESKVAFTKGPSPATSYVTPNGKTVQIDPRDAKITSLRNQLNEEKWHNRELRERTFYATYYSRPVVVYHDPYNSFFWYWLLDRSIEQQALWAYNCRYSMDQARYNELLGRNAELAARVHALESSGTVRNSAYQPAGLTDLDLMYDKSYVQAAYNPTSADAGPVLKIFLHVFLGLAIIALVVWLIFVKKW